MNRLTRAITVACLAGVAALVPAASAVASTPDLTSKTAVSQEGLIPWNAAKKGCGFDLNNCKFLRGDFVRHGYKVSEIGQYAEGATCPGGCTGGTYFFHYWKK